MVSLVLRNGSIVIRNDAVLYQSTATPLPLAQQLIVRVPYENRVYRVRGE